MTTQSKTLIDCQHDAVVLSELLRGVDLMANEGKMFDSARVAVTMVALQRAEELANDLDRLESKARVSA